jgi:uncharacterized protein YjbI with pentapeptide repeats
MSNDATELEPGADIREVSLYMADEPDVDLSNCDGRNVNGIGAKLARGKFVGADLRGALLCHCDLTGADFTDADLTDANLHGSDVSGAIFTGATLDGVVWDNVTGRKQE